MKTKKISRVLTAFLALALAVSLTNGALAVRGTLAVQSGVTLSEANGSPRFSIATNDGTTNLFQDEAGDFRNLMPGDTRVSKTISVRAAALNRSSYRIFLYARECEETADGLHVKSEDGKTNDQGMLDFLTVRVYQVEGGNRRLISDGLTMGSNPGAIGQNPSEAANAQLGATAAGALLGTFAPGHEVELQVELSVDIEAGNEFADKAAYIDWIYGARGDAGRGLRGRLSPRAVGARHGISARASGARAGPRVHGSDDRRRDGHPAGVAGRYGRRPWGRRGGQRRGRRRPDGDDRLRGAVRHRAARAARVCRKRGARRLVGLFVGA